MNDNWAKLLLTLATFIILGTTLIMQFHILNKVDVLESRQAKHQEVLKYFKDEWDELYQYYMRHEILIRDFHKDKDEGGQWLPERNRTKEKE